MSTKKIEIYSDKLPRLIKGKRKKCIALLSNGQRCNKNAIIEESLHLDNELYTYDQVTWVRAYLCEGHAPDDKDIRKLIAESKK